jgi:UDP-glucuronate decarboxylase
VAERALITGGAGFIGLHLARRLLQDGTEVTVIDDFSRGRRDAELNRLSGQVQVLQHDLTEPIPPGMIDRPFDAVYHLAAMVGVQQTADQPAAVLRRNILAAEHLLRWCERNPPGVLFLSSTSEVADGAVQSGAAGFPTPEDVPFVLTHPRLPRASYALSKAVAEAMFLQRGADFRVRIGRYYNVYGPRMGRAHVIPQFIERVIARLDPFPIYGGLQSRSFCYVDDAVAATIALARLAVPEPIVANIGNDREEIQIAELARRLLRLAGLEARLELLPPPGGSPERRLPSLATLRARLPIRPSVDLDSGLRATFDWYAAEAAGSVARRWPDGGLPARAPLAASVNGSAPTANRSGRHGG